MEIALAIIVVVALLAWPAIRYNRTFSEVKRREKYQKAVRDLQGRDPYP